METRFLIMFLITVMHAYITFGVKNYHGILIDYTLCGSNQCLNTASEIEARLNRTVDPCDNFYEFACGGWLQKTHLNQSKSYVSMFTKITEQTENQLRELFEEPAKESDTESFRKAKEIYAQCVTNNNSDANINFTAILSKYAEWPLIMPYRNWDDRHFSWQNTSKILLKSGFDNGLFNIKVKPDFQSFNSNIIFITDPVFFFTRDVLLQLNENEKAKKIMYIHIIITIALRLIDETNRLDLDTLTRDIEDIVNFEIELAKLTMDYRHYANFDKISTMLTIQEFQEKYDKQHPKTKGKIDWLVTIQNFFASEGIAIGPSEKLVVQALEYLINLVPLLERTPSRTIVNHMIWNSLQWFYFRYTNKLELSDTKIDNRWKTCIKQSNLKHAILHEYVKKYVSNNTIQNIKQIITNVRDAIREQIKNSTWMDEPTRETYLKRFMYMRHEFIMPEWYSNEAIDRYYKNINVSTNYFDTVINLYQFESKKRIRSLRTPDITFEWDIDLTLVQTYYNPSLYKTVFPPTILQNPIYDGNRILFMNYGALGFIIGHRINFALVDDHVKYNNDGTVGSLTQKSMYKYTKIMECFIDQYNKYLYPGLEDYYVDGGKAIKESLVDSAAIAAAYDAYKNRQALMNDSEWRLQGLEQYSDDQIFFIMYAQMMCENILPKIIMMRKDAIYAPNEIRIRGSLSNFPAFSAAYNCPVGKPMNPKSKCALW